MALSKPDEDSRVLAERLAMTLESMTDAFYMLDREWRFSYVNAETERLVGRSRDALLGKVIWNVFPEAIGSDIHHEYERALVDNVAVELETFYAPIGIWIQLRAFPSAQGLAVSFRDISDKVRSREAILRLNGELEQRVKERTVELEALNKELEAFAHSVAHDLRSPLAAINCFAQMLQETDARTISPRGAGFLSRIRRAATQMDDMTEGLLELARLGRTTLRLRPVDLSALALQAFESLRAQAPQRKVDVVVAPGLRACGDAVLLTQLLANLVGNAWKFSERRDSARIEVGSSGAVADQTVFFVRDNGTGFDMAYAQRLFEPFRRLHSSADYEGNGIGLATVHKIVSLHQGRVWAEAAPEQGAAFFFTLPAPAS
jgi:PAS domain S-box-containing protein